MTGWSDVFGVWVEVVGVRAWWWWQTGRVGGGKFEVPGSWQAGKGVKPGQALRTGAAAPAAGNTVWHSMAALRERLVAPAACLR